MLKRFIFLFTFILLFVGLSQAQSRLEKSKTRSPYTYIYRITSKEAQRIYKTGPKVVNTAYFHSLIDSFALNTSLNKKLPQGHYLFMYSNGPDLVYNLKTYTNDEVKILPVKPALAVMVHDSLGNSITDAEVRLNDKKASFDKLTQTYQFKKTPKTGLLAVTRQGFTLFEKLEKQGDYQYNRSLISKIIAMPPIIYIWRPFYAAYQSVRWQHPQGWVRSLFAVFNAQYRRSRSYIYRGYLATNKPMYQPGDTVKYKAFVTNKKGKPVKDKAFLQLSNYNKPVKSLGEVPPYRKGAYEGYFVLNDSLKLELDQNYTISLRQPGKRQRTFINSSFNYEDYELKENDYTLALKYEEHASGRENSLTVRGTNANGLNLLDARVEVAVITKSVIQTNASVVFIPDTLWTYQQPLEAIGETTITIPEKILPPASLDYTVTAAFLNANNERILRTKNARYLYTPGILKLSLRQDSLLVQYLEGGIDKPKAAELRTYNADYNDVATQKVQLPARLPLNAYAAGYEVTAGKLSADLELSEEEALLTLQTTRLNDSVSLALQNPRRLPYWYFVYRGEKLVARGQGKEASFFFQQPAKEEKPYFVTVQYMWAGAMHQLQADVPLPKHQLSINLQAPPVVYPGQETNMKVAVKNAAGKPISNVDLTAYAITSKFKNQQVPTMPTWDQYKRQKPYRRLIKEDGNVSGKKLMDWDYWGRRLGLDSIAYYNFLYPKNKLFTAFTFTRDSITQVSPFVVDSGRVVPVHVVYLDEVPVYFSGTDVLPAYAFAADSGYHTVKLRTADKLITLDSLYLPHRRKLIVSADITAANNPFAKAAQKGALSTYEQNVLSGYLFQVEQSPNNSTAYLKQGNRLHLLQSNNNRQFYYNARPEQLLLTGPFSSNWMQYVRLDNFITNFRMEPGYTYYFEPNLLKMWEWKLPLNKNILPYWNKGERKPELLHHEALTERKIQEAWEAAQYEQLLGKLYADNTNSNPNKNTGKLGWSLADPVQEAVRLVLLHPAGKPDALLIYPRESTVLYNLKPAVYTLTLIFKNNSFVSANVNVKANGQMQVSFKATDVRMPSPQSKYLLQLIDKKIAQQKKADKDQVNEQQLQLQTTRETTFSYTNGSDQFSHLVTGIVTDQIDGTPVPGVTVLVKGTSVGTSTDYNGRYQLYVPANGILVFSFIGYVTKEEKISARETINIKLDADAKALEEVVVVGYGVQKNRAVVSSSVATVLQGKAAGITLRGNSSVKAADAKPLLIVDGVPYSGSETDLKNVVSTKVLRGEEATALYGAAGAAGVIIITTNKGVAAVAGTESLQSDANSIRNNFSDYALWQPRLTTNKNGEATFKTTFPDDITKWNAYVLGMDGKKHSGMYSTSINAFKAMMATLHLPRFLVEGDQAQVVGKALNYLPDSAQVTTRFSLGGKQVQEKQQLLQRSFTDTLRITAPNAAPDSLEVQYSLQQTNGFADGEKRYVRIYPKGVEEKTGYFLPLPADTTFTLTFDPAKGPVKLQTQGDLLAVMLDEINYLHQYEYWCSEQAASKLKGLLLEKQIREKLGQPFTHDRMVRKLIRHLEKTQLKEGAWSWWESGPAYTWITSHVVEALVMAKKANYLINYQEQKVIDYLIYQLEKGSYYDQFTALEVLHQLKADGDYSRYVKILQKKSKPTLEEQFRLTRLQQQLQFPVQLDTLQKYKQQTMLGGMYWGEEKYSLFNNNITNTLLAYQILRAAGDHERELAQIQAYLLSERKTGHWRNTYESAQVLATLLPDLLKAVGKQNVPDNTLSFSGALNYKTNQYRTDTTFAATQPLRVQKQGKLPLYLTAYQTAWNKSPRPLLKDFVVNTSLKEMRNDVVLRAGTPVEMQVQVEVKADADYVMIEVPIPAGCSYDEKSGRGAYEVHREYYRHKVSIFCDQLPKGKYTYTIKLLPRYSGSYTLNPAKAELMYFPTFFGRNEMKQVLVK